MRLAREQKTGWKMAFDAKKKCKNLFRLYGFTLNSEALALLCQHIPEENQNAWLQNVIEVIQQQPLESAILPSSVIENAIQTSDQNHSSDDKLHIIDAFKIPKYLYHQEHKKLEPYNGPPLKLLGDSTMKAEIFRNRYTLLHQRTSRCSIFLAPVIGASSEERQKQFKLKPVEYLISTCSPLENIVILGMLTQLKEGKIFLEDVTGAVELDLTNAKFHEGLMTENCFVLAEGIYDDGIFQVQALGMPPPELSQTTRTYFGNANFFGGPLNMCSKTSVKLQRIEEENQDAMFIILSDVWLNEIKVIEKLKILFNGFSQTPPTCFIFIGNFSSGSQDLISMQSNLKRLADILTDYPAIIHKSKFIMVPGPKDAGLGQILPRPPIPKCLTEDFIKLVPNAVFTTNPCRLQYCTQEIIIFREDIITKMCRNVIRFPANSDIPKQFAKTIISQSHLCPLPLSISPIYWPYDHALQLYPLPDLIICADRYDAFCLNEMDCIIVNPGSFPRNEYNFKVYMPATKQIEDSQIADDDI